MELKDLEPKLAELKSALETSTTAAAKAAVMTEFNTLKSEFETLKAAQPKPDTETKNALSEMSAKFAELKAAADLNQPIIDAFVAAKNKPNVEQKAKTFEENVADAILDATDDVQKFINKETKSLVLELKAVGDMATANVTGGSRYGQQFAPNIIQAPYRKVHVRDLLPVSAAGPGNTFTYMKENGPGEGSIAPVLESATKPQFDLDLIEATVNFETIAGWMRVTRKAMNNIPGFTSWIQSRVPEKLMQVEDAQILYGNGTSPNLKGIGTAGNFTAALTGSTNLEEALIDALSQLEDTNERYATGIVVRPRVLFNFFKNKASGSGEYDLPDNFVFQGNQLYISGVPVVASTAVTAGDYFVGDWQQGAALLVQEGMRLEFFEQDGTNVRENKITVRIEETVALPVYGSDYFIKGNDATES